jgi:hypothetical protein
MVRLFIGDDYRLHGFRGLPHDSEVNWAGTHSCAIPRNMPSCYADGMTNNDVLHNDLDVFDAACQRLHDDGLLSDETLVRLHGIVHREAWEMRSISWM